MLRLPTRKHNWGPNGNANNSNISSWITEDDFIFWATENTTPNAISSISWQRRTPKAGKLLGWVVKSFSDLSKNQCMLLCPRYWLHPKAGFLYPCNVVVIRNQGYMPLCSHLVIKREAGFLLFSLKTKKVFFLKDPSKFLLLSHWLKMA